ncbi:MAG: hypothetical protein HDS68_04390 [Bacteroidales bacterium]|nr:hypothetical protein [Bacteroidales bacterium]
MHSQEYLNEMLHLTADIAEELLTLKDTGNELSDVTTEKIARLAELAISCRADATDEISTVMATPAVEQPIINNPELPTEPVADEPHSVTGPTTVFCAEDADRESVVVEEGEIILSNKTDHISYSQDETETDLILNQTSDVKAESCPDSEELHDKKDVTPEPEEALSDHNISNPQEPYVSRKQHFSARELRNAFTLNDVFLFQRTLFHGSSIEFKQALEEIASLSDSRELEEYLVSAHGVDLSSPEAEDFINIVKTFF